MKRIYEVETSERGGVGGTYRSFTVEAATVEGAIAKVTRIIRRGHAHIRERIKKVELLCEVDE